MRVGFQQCPWDVYGCISYCLVMTGLLLGLGVTTWAAVPLILFAPGYLFVAVLFPSNGEIDWIERSILSFCMSLAIVPILAFGLAFSPWGIQFSPVVGMVGGLTISLAAIAYLRRSRLKTSERLSATIVLQLPGWGDYGQVEKALILFLGASLLVAAAVVAYVVISPRPSETFTEFYILGPSGNASGYPTNLMPLQPGTVILGILSHEAGTVNYTIRVDLVGVRAVFNTTSGRNETVELNRTTLSWINVTLASSRNWTQPYTFRIKDTGLWKVQVLLFKDGVFSSPYREVHLFVRVQ